MKNILYVMIVTVIFSSCWFSDKTDCPGWTALDDSLFPYKKIENLKFNNDSSTIIYQVNIRNFAPKKVSDCGNDSDDCYANADANFQSDKIQIELRYDRLGSISLAFTINITYLVNKSYFTHDIDNYSSDTTGSKFVYLTNYNIDGIVYNKILLLSKDFSEIYFSDPSYKTYVSKIYYAFGTGIVQFEQENPHKVWTLVRE